MTDVSNWPLLSVLIWLPIIGGALILALRNAQAARWASVGVGRLAKRRGMAQVTLGGGPRACGGASRRVRPAMAPVR